MVWKRWLLFKYWPMFGIYSFNFREGITKDFRPWINLDQRPSLQVHIAGLAREAASMVAQRVDPVVSYFFLKIWGPNWVYCLFLGFLKIVALNCRKTRGTPNDRKDGTKLLVFWWKDEKKEKENMHVLESGRVSLLEYTRNSRKYTRNDCMWWWKGYPMEGISQRVFNAYFSYRHSCANDTWQWWQPADDTTILEEKYVWDCDRVLSPIRGMPDVHPTFSISIFWLFSPMTGHRRRRQAELFGSGFEGF